MHRANEIAAFVVSVEDTPSRVKLAARRVLLDTVGAALAGAATQGGVATLAGATMSWGEGKAQVWFCNTRLTPPGAAFVNAAYASMLDIDDGHRAAAGHPGAAIVPAVLTVARMVKAGPDRILSAIALGYEAALRIAAARDINSIRTTDTGRWCGYGVAAACGWLRGLPADKIAHAMAIAGHTASSQAATGWTKLGHVVKEGIPFATAAALTAVDLAQAGYTGPVDLLDDPGRYDQQRLTKDLGVRWEIERNYFKIYSACRWAHAPVDAALALQARGRVDAREIDGINIGLFARALTLLNQPDPSSIHAAQYSIPFSVALALTHGKQALLPMTEEFLHSPWVTTLAHRIVLHHQPDLDPLFPGETPASVEIRYRGQTDCLYLDAPKGEPSNPLSDQDLIDKFNALAHGRMSASDAARLRTALLSFGAGDETDNLFQAMGGRVECCPDGTADAPGNTNEGLVNHR
ncbi:MULTISPECIES: MmgE/PrpD family protein [unclassified Mesorhizobium]|uniref:MmgE/PrpD family protein n=1 Tax=unclassified Mesorhizobium TaxID=325217 RepID=UPI001CCB33B0|nr:MULTISPECIES: MmgE/PrpD family protein [unclassified Mesorhizobium]MBZ9742228.1 MmgE/PrpD family protein [Mesorhizobium sp. CO1-1-4]MBZ9805832.1 MmgE/PrpD family protein [Mesorhizobium sp. ES1-6]